MKRFQLRGAMVALALSTVCGAFAAAFTPGNLVVLQVGADGGPALTNAAQPIFLKEYTTAGVLVQTIALPSVGPGNRLTQSGTATSEGQLILGPGGIALVGYNADAGTASVVSTTAAVANRMVAVVDLSGNVNLTTALGDAYSGNNIRSAVAGAGGDIWTGGTAPSANGPGVRYTTLGGTTSTQLSTTVTNIRVVNIYNGQLYCSTQSGSNIGINVVGTGLPTTSGQTISLLTGMTNDVVNAMNQSPYGFAFFDDNTLYVADDRTTANGGGLIKYTKDSFGTWSVAYRLQLGLPAGFTGTRSVSVVGTDGSGNAILAVAAGQQNESTAN